MLVMERAAHMQIESSYVENPKIFTRGLRVFYGKKLVLKNINIDIPEGKITVIMGPSGSGKSTLLRVFNRMIDLVENAKVEGKVVLDGRDIYHDGISLVELRRRVGMVFQRPTPLPMSIYDNVAFGPRIHGIAKTKEELDSIVERSLKLAGLWDEVKDRLHDPAAALSGGQQQRLAIARALAVDPEVLLLDEPTASLDPIATQKIEETIRGLAGKYTIVLVTHDVEQAMRVADHVIFVYKGEVVEQAPADEFFANPKDERARLFIAKQAI